MNSASNLWEREVGFWDYHRELPDGGRQYRSNCWMGFRGRSELTVGTGGTRTRYHGDMYDSAWRRGWKKSFVIKLSSKLSGTALIDYYRLKLILRRFLLCAKEKQAAAKQTFVFLAPITNMRLTLVRRRVRSTGMWVYKPVSKLSESHHLFLRTPKSVERSNLWRNSY